MKLSREELHSRFHKPFEIWCANVFVETEQKSMTYENVSLKRAPLNYHLQDERFSDRFIKQLRSDKKSTKKQQLKVTITYLKYIGDVNGPIVEELY